jgi:hypothetical protein
LTAVIRDDQLELDWGPLLPRLRNLPAVTVAWRQDDFPVRPDEHGARWRVLRRGALGATYRLPHGVPRADRLFVRIFEAQERDGIWPALTATPITGSDVLALPACGVSYRLVRLAGGSSLEVVAETDDGSPLPELVVVWQAGRAPFNAADGGEIGSLGGRGRPQERRAFQTEACPPKSFFRVFLADPQDHPRVTLTARPPDDAGLRAS